MIARFVYAYRYFRRDLGLPLGRALRSAWREARRGVSMVPRWLWFGPIWNSLPPLNRQQRRMIAARIRKG